MACQQVQEKGFPLATDLAIQSTAATGQSLEKASTPAANIIFQSADGGQTWQDISAGLPEDLQAGGFFTDDSGFYLYAKNKMYRTHSACTALAWEKEVLPGDRGATVFPGRDRLLAFDAEDGFFQKMNGTSAWLPMFTNYQYQSMRTIFEASDGTLFVGCDYGIFKSADQGETWKNVFKDGWVINMVESGGVLLCTNEQGILRSTDNGENWEVVLNEGGVGIAVEVIKGGFAAITYNTESKTRRVRISADGGKTWQAIDADLPPSMLIASIKQVGEYFFCGHPDGIFRSSDGGKTWKRVLPSIGKKVFNLSVSGGVIYAVPRDGGC